LRRDWLLKWQKLVLIMDFDDGYTVRELGRRIRSRFDDMTSNAYLRTVLPKMRRKGIVISRSKDGRCFYWYLTEKGYEIKKALSGVEWY